MDMQQRKKIIEFLIETRYKRKYERDARQPIEALQKLTRDRFIHWNWSGVFEEIEEYFIFCHLDKQASPQEQAEQIEQGKQAAQFKINELTKTL